MTIQTVIDNLARTIAGKRELLAVMEHEGSTWSTGLTEVVRMNVEELERIHKDLVAAKGS